MEIKVDEITSRFHRRGHGGHKEQKEFRRLHRLCRFTQIRHSGVVISSSFDIRASSSRTSVSSVVVCSLPIVGRCNTSTPQRINPASAKWNQLDAEL
jgi:hypothetical protein